MFITKNHKTSIISIFISLTMIISFAPVFADNVRLVVGLDESAVVGDTIKGYVSFDKEIELASMSFDLNYDEDILKVTNVILLDGLSEFKFDPSQDEKDVEYDEHGNELETLDVEVIINLNNTGIIKLVAAKAKNALFTANEHFLVIEFEAIAPGKTSLTANNVVLYTVIDGELGGERPIPDVVNDNEVIVLTEPMPTPGIIDQGGYLNINNNFSDGMILPANRDLVITGRGHYYGSLRGENGDIMYFDGGIVTITLTGGGQTFSGRGSVWSAWLNLNVILNTASIQPSDTPYTLTINMSNYIVYTYENITFGTALSEEDSDIIITEGCVTGVKLGSTPVNARVAVAAYNDGMLTALTFANVEQGDFTNGIANIQVDLILPDATDTVKAIILDNEDNVQPLMENIIKNY